MKPRSAIAGTRRCATCADGLVQPGEIDCPPCRENKRNGEWLKRERESAGLGIKDVVDALRPLPYTVSNLTSWEAGLRPIPVEALQSLHQLFAPVEPVPATAIAATDVIGWIRRLEAENHALRQAAGSQPSPALVAEWKVKAERWDRLRRDLVE